MAQQHLPTQTRSHGRGGAGNINAKIPTTVTAEDLRTPVLRGTSYTTGRGGAGNMALNDPTNPSEARTAQDVETPLHHNKDPHGTYHWGRGGEGNMTTLGQSGAEQARQKSLERKAHSKERRTLSKGEEGAKRPSFSGAINKGREMLGLNGAGKKGGAVQDPKNESAIE